MLTAIHANGKGRLYSSDFPFFRLEKPEQYIGILVDSGLKPHWELYLGGDKRNLQEIAKRIDRVNLFHYDSDKSISGRRFAVQFIEPYLDHEAVIVMDDIQDNLFFRNYVETKGLRYRVFRFERKYLGIVGL